MRPTTRAVLIAAVFTVAATGVAASFWWPVYRDPHFVIMCAVAGSMGILLAALSVLRGWPAWALAVSGIVLFLAVGVPLAVPSQVVGGLFPSLPGLLDLVAGVALGWKQLLTITVPVGAYQALLVPPYVLVLTSAILGVRLGARERGGSWALAGPIVLAVTGILFGADSPPHSVPLTLTLFALCLAWLGGRRLLRRRAALRALGASSRGTGTGRTVLSGLAIFSIACLVAIGATSALPLLSERRMLRDSVEQPVDLSSESSPLAAFRSYLRDGADTTVHLRVSGLESADRLRIAVLDRYDGVVYGVGGPADGGSGTFVPIPTSIDRESGLGEARTIEISVAAYHEVWLPTVGLVEQVSFDDASRRSDYVVSLTTGTAALVGGVRPGETYREQGLAPGFVDVADLADLTPGGSDLPAVEVVPDGLAALLDSWVGGASDPGQRLADALTRVASTGYISHGLTAEEPPSRSGHGADRIAELISSSRMIGDAEQYSVLAALTARQLGFPARVVVGFAPAAAGRPGTIDVLGSDISAWIEVETAERGWVSVDPVPPVRPIPDEDPDELNRISRPQSVVPPPAESAPDADEQSPPETDRDEPNSLDPVLAAFLVVARIVGIVLTVAGILAAPFLLVVAAKVQRRRRRRRAREPFERVRGGWDDFADAALDHGVAVPPSSTRSEFASHVGVLPARLLAAAVDRATFAPEHVDDADAQRVWEAADELRAGLDASAGFWARVRALVSVRSFRSGYRGIIVFGGRRERQ